MKIKEVGERFEVMSSTAAGLTHKEGVGRVKQVRGGQGGSGQADKDMDKITSYLCRAKGHFSKEWKVPKKRVFHAAGEIQRGSIIPTTFARQSKQRRRIQWAI